MYVYPYKGSRKKKLSLNGRAIKRGGGGKARPLRKKLFFLTFFSNVPKCQRPLREELCLRLP